MDAILLFVITNPLFLGLYTPRRKVDVGDHQILDIRLNKIDY
jgi:hypothetical protein